LIQQRLWKRIDLHLHKQLKQRNSEAETLEGKDFRQRSSTLRVAAVADLRPCVVEFETWCKLPW
jgi:hypothetical protein